MITDPQVWKDAAEHAQHVYDNRKRKGGHNPLPEVRLTAYGLSVHLLTVEQFAELVRAALAAAQAGVNEQGSTVVREAMQQFNDASHWKRLGYAEGFAAGIEAAAKVCDGRATTNQEASNGIAAASLTVAAQAIRALSSASAETESEVM